MNEQDTKQVSDAEKQAEVLLQQHRSEQASERKPHKNHRVALALFFVVLLAIITSVSLFLINGADNTEDPEPTNNQTTPAQNEEQSSEPELSSEYLESYTIDDTGFGTKVSVVVDEARDTRTMERNALPNHNTGEFPNDGNPNEISEQDFTQTFPLTPRFTGNAVFARTVGIAINGVKFEPDTAERAVCDGNVEHSIEAIQDVTDLGLDFNNAHVQPNGEYHYHGVSDLLVGIYSTDNDLVHIGFASDGHLMFYSKSSAYAPSYRLGTDNRAGSNCSYTVPGPSGGEVITFGPEKDGSLKSDWEYNASYGDLDECNGIEIDGQYIYLVTDEYSYVGRCLNGEFSEEQPSGNAPSNGGQPSGPPSGPPPSGLGAPQ